MARIIIDRVFVYTQEDGFIEKLHSYRNQGYQTLWTGNGAICLAKYKEM